MTNTAEQNEVEALLKFANGDAGQREAAVEASNVGSLLGVRQEQKRRTQSQGRQATPMFDRLAEALDRAEDGGTGAHNTVFGYPAGSAVSTGGNNTRIGFAALEDDYEYSTEDELQEEEEEEPSAPLPAQPSAELEYKPRAINRLYRAPSTTGDATEK